MAEDEGTLRQRRERTNKILKKQAAGLERVSKHRLEELKHTNMVLFHDLADRKFVELVRSLIERNGGNGIQVWDIYRETAYELGISTETAKRYLIAHSARRAEFMNWGKLLLLNADYQPMQEESEDENEQ